MCPQLGKVERPNLGFLYIIQHHRHPGHPDTTTWVTPLRQKSAFPSSAGLSRSAGNQLQNNVLTDPPQSIHKWHQNNLWVELSSAFVLFDFAARTLPSPEERLALDQHSCSANFTDRHRLRIPAQPESFAAFWLTSVLALNTMEAVSSEWLSTERKKTIARANSGLTLDRVHYRRSNLWSLPGQHIQECCKMFGKREFLTRPLGSKLFHNKGYFEVKFSPWLAFRDGLYFGIYIGRSFFWAALAM